MKLHEILNEVTIPMDLDSPYDEMELRDQEEANAAPQDKTHKERMRMVSSKKNSNVAKATRIRHRAEMKKRKSNPEQDDTHHTSHIGGHGSTFLFR